MTLHSCHIHIAMLTNMYVSLNAFASKFHIFLFFFYRSTPDFILSTYMTPITQLAKQIQNNESYINIQVSV